MEINDRVDLLEEKLTDLNLRHVQLSNRVGSPDEGLIMQYAKLEACLERLTTKIGYIQTIMIVGIVLAIGRDGIIILLKALAH